MKIYTFFSEFKGKTYIDHYKAPNKEVAFHLWYESFLRRPTISRMQRVHIIEAHNDRDYDPCYLVGVSNVLCWWISAWRKPLLVNYMETIDFNSHLAGFAYTFIVMFEGGTYIHQETISDFKKSYNQWLAYFLNEPKIARVVNEMQKEELAKYDADKVVSLIEKSEYVHKLSLTILGSPFEMYITKTPTETE